MSLRRQLLTVLAGAVFLGLIASGLLTLAWVNENLSGDFVDQQTGAIDFGFSTGVFLVWTAAIAAPLAILGAVIVVLAHLTRQSLAGPSNSPTNDRIGGG